MIDSQIHVAIRSYGRPKTVTTLAVVPFAHVWVPESQGDAYRESYGDRVVTVPDDEDGNICRKSNAILDRSPCPWTLILDDDITWISSIDNQVQRRLNADEIEHMIAQGFVTASGCGCRLWGINPDPDEHRYKTYQPFNFLAYIAGPLNGHLEPQLRYDEGVPTHDDVDFFLQNIRRYRRALRMNRYSLLHDHGRKAGGLAGKRSQAVERQSSSALLRKWGSKCVQRGGVALGARGKRTDRTSNLLNTLVRVPISGV